MWWFKSKKRKSKDKITKKENAGYKYAAVKLLKGIPAREIYSHVACAHHFNDYSSFDHGIEQALEDWKNKTGEEYDYMGEMII